MKNKILKIEVERCKGCDLCVIYCPKKCLKLSPGFNRAGHHAVELAKKEECNFCGTCYIMCPDYAISIEDSTRV